MLDYCSILLLLLHVTTFGAILGQLFLPRSTNSWTRIGASGCIGMLAFGLEILVLGYIGALDKLNLCVSSGVMLIALIVWLSRKAGDIGMEARGFARALVQEARTHKWLALISAATLVALLGCCWWPPLATDELEYHWAAPQFWAHAAKWIAAPYKLVNGPALMEWVYTWSAIWQSSTSAHFTHWLLTVFLLCGAAGIAVTIRSSALVALASCLAIPVIVCQAAISYNDVAMSAFLVNAYSILFGLDEESEELNARKHISTGVLLGAGYLTKSLALGAVPIAVLYAWSRRSKIALHRRSLSCCLMIVPIVAMVIVGCAHTYQLTGKLSDPSRTPQIGTIPPKPNYAAAIYIARDSSDPMLSNGCAAGRIPTWKDLALLPLTPFITSILGQNEPYGGRTGILLLMFLPFVASWIRRTNLVHLWLLLAAAGYFAVVAPVFIKTRFHIFVWVLLSVCATAAYTGLAKTKNNRVMSALLVFAVALGIADAGRTLYKMHSIYAAEPLSQQAVAGEDR